MGRDKARDDKFFNCSEKYEYRYVSNLYGINSEEVHLFLAEKCQDGTIYYSTHMEVYRYIKKMLGYAILA